MLPAVRDSAATPPRCAHCSESVPKGLIVDGDAEQFCCNGCRTVREVITGCGLERYYALRDGEASSRSTRVSLRPARASEFADPVFAERHVRMLPGGFACVDLFLENVHCSACLWLVERLPRVVPGVVESRLDLRRAMVRVTWAPDRTDLPTIARALERLGYPPHPVRERAARLSRQREERRQLVRLGVAGACAGNVMLLAVAMYAGLFQTMAPEHLALLRWTSMALSVVAIAWPGAVFIRGAVAALRTRTMHLDLPIAVGLGVGAVWGVINTFRGDGEIYFDSLSVLVFALLLGRYVQARQHRFSADAVELLFSLTPSSATLVDWALFDERPTGSATALDPSLECIAAADPFPRGLHRGLDRALDRALDHRVLSSARSVPIERVARGDCALVRSGESVPADGIVVLGSSRVDRSLLTGESEPVAVGPGDSIAAGSVNLLAPFVVRVEATGEATRIGRLMKIVAEAAERRAPIVRLADRLAGWFTLAALTLAALTAAIWWHQSPSSAIERAVALLIVTCPCGLGLATPLAVTVAIGRAARCGILIKGGEAIERLASRNRRHRADGAGDAGDLASTSASAKARAQPRHRGIVLLDKTGTLTEGRLTVVEVAGDPTAVGLAASAERHASHPIAEAIRRHACDPSQRAFFEHPDDSTVLDAHTQIGSGVSALVDGRRVIVGSPAFVRESLARGSRSPRNGSDQLSPELEVAIAEKGRTPIAIAVDDHLAAIVGLGDAIRPDTAHALDRVRALGWEVAILSGDHQRVVDSVGDQLGIPSARRLGSQSPEAKLAAVTASMCERPTVMVGDGVNDAAALAAATVGIAVHGGAEASLAAADIHLATPGLGGIADVLEGAQRTLRTVRLNLAVSLGYNAVASLLCLSGFISPLLAAIIMPVSSLTVVALSVRRRSFTPSSRVRATASGVVSPSWTDSTPSTNSAPELAPLEVSP